MTPITWRFRGLRGSGALADLGSHLTDTAEFLPGPVESVSGAALTTVFRQRLVPAGTRHRPCPGRGGAGAPAGRERRLGQLLRPLRWRCDRRPERARIAYGHPNTLKVEVFCEEGALAFAVSRAEEFQIATGGSPGDTADFRRVIVGVDHPYISGGLAMDATGIGTGHNDSFAYQARAFLDEVAGRQEIPWNASFGDGLHSLQVQEAVVRAACNPAAGASVA